VKVVLGLGCDRNAAIETVGTAIEKALLSVDLTHDCVTGAASIDKKSDEVAILAVCAKHDWDIVWYPAEILAKVDVPNPSEVVLKYVGTPSVGEAAAILCAGGTKDDLVVEKFKYKGADGKNATVSVVRVNHE